MSADAGTLEYVAGSSDLVETAAFYVKINMINPPWKYKIISLKSLAVRNYRKHRFTLFKNVISCLITSSNL